MTDVFEGSIIRCIRRLEEILRQMCQASKAIGNIELENKFAEGNIFVVIVIVGTEQSEIVLICLRVVILYIIMIY